MIHSGERRRAKEKEGVLSLELRVTESGEKGFVLPDLAQREVCDGLLVPSDNRAEERHGATKKVDGGEWMILRELLIW
jgi:hypothetical protein